MGRGPGQDRHRADGTRVAANFSFIADYRPGRRLAVVLFPAADGLDERAPRARPPDSHVLTDRERQILTLVALGNTGEQIAAQLSLAPSTVQTHVMNALNKLRAKNRAHGIAIALLAGELDLDDGLDGPQLLDSRTTPRPRRR